MTILFYSSAVLSIIATFLAITRHHPIHALLYVILSLISLSVMMFSIGAFLAAALEVIVYAGAIMVLFVFVVLIINPLTHEDVKCHFNFKKLILPVFMMLILTGEFVFALFLQQPTKIVSEFVDVKSVSQELFSTYAIGVELSSMILLAGLVGAFHLARRSKKKEGEIS